MDDIYKICICELKSQLEKQQNSVIDAYELKINNFEHPSSLSSFKIIEFSNIEKIICRDFIFVLNDGEVMENLQWEIKEFAINCLCKNPVQTNQNKNFQMRLVKITNKVAFEVISTNSFETVCSLNNIKLTTSSAKEIDRIKCI